MNTENFAMMCLLFFFCHFFFGGGHKGINDLKGFFLSQQLQILYNSFIEWDVCSLWFFKSLNILRLML